MLYPFVNLVYETKRNTIIIKTENNGCRLRSGTGNEEVQLPQLPSNWGREKLGSAVFAPITLDFECPV